MHRGECCFFSLFFFFFLSFFSSGANPEPGPGLPLRCSLAHKHKTAFIILPVAAQGLASKSYWFLSSFSPLYKGRAFCKLLTRFRPTKGTFIETSLPPLRSLYPPAIWFCSNLITRLEKGGEEKRRGNKKAPQMARSFSAVNGFIRAAFIHAAIQRCFSRTAEKRTWQNYWFGCWFTELRRGTLHKKSLPSLFSSLFVSPCLCYSQGPSDSNSRCPSCLCVCVCLDLFFNGTHSRLNVSQIEK